MSILIGIAQRFAIVYGFQAAWWLVGEAMKVTKSWKQKAETIDYDKVQEYINRQKEIQNG